MVGGKGLPGAGVEPDLGPGFFPAAGWVGGGVGGQYGLVEFLMGVLQPGGALVIKIGEGVFLETGVPGGGGHDRRLANQSPGVFRYVFEFILLADFFGDRVDPFGGSYASALGRRSIPSLLRLFGYRSRPA